METWQMVFLLFYLRITLFYGENQALRQFLLQIIDKLFVFIELKLFRIEIQGGLGSWFDT